MSGVILEVILILLLVLASGLLSMAEIALLSCRRTRIRQLAEEGDPRARIVQDLTRDPPRLLSTIQSGVSRVGILTGALGRTALAGRLAGSFPMRNSVGRWAGSSWPIWAGSPGSPTR